MADRFSAEAQGHGRPSNSGWSISARRSYGDRRAVQRKRPSAGPRSARPATISASLLCRETITCRSRLIDMRVAHGDKSFFKGPKPKRLKGHVSDKDNRGYARSGRRERNGKAQAPARFDIGFPG